MGAAAGVHEHPQHCGAVPGPSTGRVEQGADQIQRKAAMPMTLLHGFSPHHLHCPNDVNGHIMHGHIMQCTIYLLEDTSSVIYCLCFDLQMSPMQLMKGVTPCKHLASRERSRSCAGPKHGTRAHAAT